MLERFDEVMAIMLPSLREERAATYSPFLPICPRTGVVLQVPIVAHDVKAGTVSYDDPETKERVTLPVTGGHCKLQWKPDWAMRWFALGVDYEMAGKDLIDSVKLSGKICAALGGTPPEGFNYELFLDDKGQKISKSKGNGLTIDEWLRYASPESLSLFMYREPKSAKRLYFDVIPRNVDDYQQFLDGFSRQDGRQQLQNPVWHIHSGKPPKADMPVTFQLLLTLVSSSNAENAETLWGFIGRYRPGVTPQTHPKLDAMVGYAINYYRDFVAPTKKFREPTDSERAALQDLRDALSNMPAGSSAEDIQNVVYEIGRREPFLDQVKKGKDGRPGVSLDWFNMLYQVLLGSGKRPALRLLCRGLRRDECGRDDRRRAGKKRVASFPSPIEVGCIRLRSIGCPSEGAVRRRLASAGRAIPQLRQGVGDRPAQLPDRFVGEDRSRASEPVDADIQDGQCLLELRQLGLKDRVFSCLDLPKGVAKRPDFRRQVSDIRQHVFLRQIDFRQHGLSHRCSDVFGKMVDARNRDERNNRGDDHQDRRRIDQRQQQLAREPQQPRGNPTAIGLGHGCLLSSLALGSSVIVRRRPQPHRRAACAEGYAGVGALAPLPAWTGVNAFAP